MESMSIVPKATGSGVLKVRVGEVDPKLVMQIPIVIADEVLQTSYSATRSDVGRNKFGIGYLETSDSQRFIKNPFVDKVTIQVESGRGCLLQRDAQGAIKVANCIDAEESVSVGYDQTIQGLLVRKWVKAGTVSLRYHGRQVR